MINYPSRGIGTTTLERATRWAHERGTTLWTAVTRLDEVGGIQPGPRRAVVGFVATVKKLQAALSRDGVERATRTLIDDIDLVGDLRAGSPSLGAAQRRIDNVDGLVRSLARHATAGGGRQALMEYLRRLALDSNDDDATTDAGDRVTLTTLHGAKGLEFPVVFLIGAEEELLPHWRALTPHASDVGDPEHVADVSEERRLAYVGITRAREKLYITRSKLRRKHGVEVERAPSRFLEEIPKELIDPRDLIAEAQEEVGTDELRDFFKNFGKD